MKQVGTADWDRERLNMFVKHSSQLVCTCSEDAARDSICAGSTARFNMLKYLTYVGLGE